MNCFFKAAAVALLAVATSLSAFAFDGFDRSFIQAFDSAKRQTMASQMEFLQVAAGPSPTAELSGCEFQKRKDANFSFTDDVVWARLRLANPTDRSVSRVLMVNHIYLSELDFYRGADCRGLELLARRGLDRELDPAFPTVGGFATELTLQARDSTEVYVRAKSKYPISLPVQVLTDRDYLREVNALDLMLAAYAAFVGALMLYNLVLSLITRERVFLSYVLTIVSLHLFTNLAQYGLIKERFFPDWLFLHRHVFHFAHAASLTSVAMFVSDFLRSSLSRFSIRFFWCLALLTIPLSVAGVLTGSPFVDLAMQINTTVFSLSLFFVAGQRALRNKDRPARYFFYAWSLLIFAWVMNFLKISGFIPSTPFNESLILVGAAAECLLLSLAIADRIRTLTLEKNDLLNRVVLTNQRNAILRQVSHDIRSPLSALNMVVSVLHEGSEDQKRLLRAVSRRINDIADSLLQQGRSAPPGAGTWLPRTITKGDQVPERLTALAPLVDSIVSEKRMQYRAHAGVTIEAQISDGYSAFSTVDPSEFARCLSNLVNNSVEAMSESIRVVVSIRETGGFVTISVCDDGKGIPSDILPMLGSEGGSYGKDGSQSGWGLGLHHAKSVAERYGGKLSIVSSVGKGTEVAFALPKSNPPSWLVRSLEIGPGATLVSVSADESFHRVWRDRLGSMGALRDEITLRTFSRVEQMSAWQREHKGDFMLLDFDSLDVTEVDPEVWGALRAGDRTLLVTSRHDEEETQTKAKTIGARILPKALARFVPISIIGRKSPIRSPDRPSDARLH